MLDHILTLIAAAAVLIAAASWAKALPPAASGIAGAAPAGIALVPNDV
jgi:hypothetical protein